MTDKESFRARQQERPILVSLGAPEQRQAL
jgi:hypothetical protein